MRPAGIDSTGTLDNEHDMAEVRHVWSSVKRIVAEAIEAPPEQRRAIIEARAGSDISLRDEVESLIRASEGADGVLTPALDACVGLNGADLAGLGGQRIGRYQLERLIAEGSTSAVY